MSRVFGDSFYFMSLTDCISFEAMRSEGINETLTGDHNFAQAGFTLLMDPRQLE